MMTKESSSQDRRDLSHIILIASWIVWLVQPSLRVFKSMIKRLVYRSLKFLDAERSHNIAKWGMKRKLCAPGPYRSDRSRAIMWGVPLNNPLGLAAGFDKNGELVDVIQDYGFGYVEVGSVTFRGGKGNPRPRLFRIGSQDILNRMGLNGEPAHRVAERLSKCQSKAYGVNIAKTHDPSIVGPAAIDDIIGSYKLLKTFGIYTVINVSCPNTKEGKTFETPESIRELLTALEPFRQGARPLLVKVSPLLLEEQLLNLAEVCEDFNIQGYVVSNTVPLDHPLFGKGGRSGRAVFERAPQLVEQLYNRYPNRMIIGVGGIFEGRDMITYHVRGANFFQAYCGFVNGPNAGVDFAHKVNAEADGYAMTDKERDTLRDVK